ncbi:uncharacterized protein [Physcomitrium patens]|uniref:Uncharacterized protein n=1 Tax=Physcomitrium patens TaxID=3218 RepID=A0A2K1JYH4_PHYPA|nr:uncharacterized protein LOC112287725 [Physcomitrium patens]PNR46572.1 hypothetical protein PHYPA_013691 [Physcomitrium patens]|eukprot:XP_024386825.1 uncharacterized protein LOC112287725 [Physcomitrella patens]
MALIMQAFGCSSTFTSGAPLVGVRRSPSVCKRAGTLSPRSSLVLPGGDECYLSRVDYEDVSNQWLSADFLDLRLRSSGLICNEAVQALQKHFQKKGVKQPGVHEASVASSNTNQQILASSSACQVKAPAIPRVVVFDEALFAQLYNPSTIYTTTCSILDETFC